MYTFSSNVGANAEFNIGAISDFVSIPNGSTVIGAYTTNISGSATVISYSVGGRVYARSSTQIPSGLKLTFRVYYK